MKRFISVIPLGVLFALMVGLAHIPSSAEAKLEANIFRKMRITLTDDQLKATEECEWAYLRLQANKKLVDQGFPNPITINSAKVDHGEIRSSEGSASNWICFFDITMINGTHQFYLADTDLASKTTTGTRFEVLEQIRLVKLNPLAASPTLGHNILARIQELDPSIYPTSDTLAVNDVVFSESYDRPTRIARCLVHFIVGSQNSNLRRMSDEQYLYVDYDIEADQGSLFILQAIQVGSYR